MRRLALLALAPWATACAQEPRPEPAAELVLRFRHQMGDEAMRLGQAYGTRYGQTVSFDHLRYWVSNVELEDAQGAVVHVPDSYYLVEQTADGDRLDVSVPVPQGEYSVLAFHLGVDAGPNASLDLMAGELKPGIGMDWDWDTGYKFFRTEGTFEEQGTQGQFVIHTGNDVLYRRLSAELEQPLSLVIDETQEVIVEAELDRLFAGIELSKQSQILGGPLDSLSGQITGNYGRMFFVVTPDETVRMTASAPRVDEEEQETPTDGTAPVLSATIIDLPDALSCEPVPARPSEAERACMTPFGLGPGSAWEDAGFLTFVTHNGASVRAASTGVVAEIVYTDHSDLTHSDIFTVIVRPNEDSAFFLEYRGLKELAVGQGDLVEAGQPLGAAGDYFDTTFGRVSFAVRRQQELLQRLCPTRYTSADVAAAFEDGLTHSNAAWADHSHDAPCTTGSLVCNTERCETPADFVAAQGDVDAGRRIWSSSCASCHGAQGEGGVASPVCGGPSCCADCVDHPTLAARVAFDMPPEGECIGRCAEDVAAFILHELAMP